MNNKILVVDDDRDILLILQRWLKDAGYTNIKATDSGGEAIALLKEEWDLVISDIFLPDLDGIDYAQLIKQKYQACRVLLMTGSLNTDVTLRALDTNIDGFLSKPTDKAKLLSKVREQLRKAVSNNATSPKQRVLAIGAHPDDVEIGCGGILVNHRNNGDEIAILTLSSGKCGGETAIRIKEAMKAAAILQANLFMGGLEDTRISEGTETIEAISSVVQKFEPNIVYTHSKNDSHQDHRNCYSATIVSARSVQELQSYQSPSSNIQFTPSRFVDISNTIKEKQNLISCYRTQTTKCRYLKESLITSTAEYWGRYAGFGLVEPLEVIRTI